MTAPKILLVEDSPEDILFFKRAVDRMGLRWDLDVAENGQEALDRLSVPSGRPSHVILDLKLPHVSGLDVLAWIRGHPDLGKLPVIVLTSSRLETDMAQASGLGIDDFLIKPVSFKELVEIVRAIAERWSLPVGSPK